MLSLFWFLTGMLVSWMIQQEIKDERQRRRNEKREKVSDLSSWERFDQ